MLSERSAKDHDKLAKPAKDQVMAGLVKWRKNRPKHETPGFSATDVNGCEDRPGPD